MEEISWEQRLLACRPATYFLEYNYQQEFNFHTIVETDYRKLALSLVIGGYGILLPLAAQFSYIKGWFQRLAIAPPPVALLPAFAGTFLVCFLYHWSRLGEWVELMPGLSFLLGAIQMPRDYSDGDQSGLARSRCNLHKRLYTFVEEYGQTNPCKGSYSNLQSQGLPKERAEFYLDPWNSP